MEFFSAWRDRIYTLSGFQNLTNILSELGKQICMEVNLDKTKIMVFRKDGFLAKDNQLFYSNIQLEVINVYDLSR